MVDERNGGDVLQKAEQQALKACNFLLILLSDSVYGSFSINVHHS